MILYLFIQEVVVLLSSGGLIRSSVEELRNALHEGNISDEWVFSFVLS